MSCHYPVCMMGGADCSYRQQCDAEAKANWNKLEEKRLLDIAEQKARIANMEADTALKVKLKIEADLKSMGDT